MPANPSAPLSRKRLREIRALADDRRDAFGQRMTSDLQLEDRFATLRGPETVVMSGPGFAALRTLVEEIAAAAIAFDRARSLGASHPSQPIEAELDRISGLLVDFDGHSTHASAADHLAEILERFRATPSAVSDAGDATLADAVREYLSCVEAVDAEARRAEQPGANAWSSAPVVAQIKARERLAELVSGRSSGSSAEEAPDTTRLNFLDERYVVSITFFDGSELNPGSLSLRAAIDNMRPAAVSSVEIPENDHGKPDGREDPTYTAAGENTRRGDYTYDAESGR